MLCVCWQVCYVYVSRYVICVGRYVIGVLAGYVIGVLAGMSLVC